MSRAVRIHEYGGPEVLRWEELPTPVPGPDEVLILQDAVGLNFIDIYYRTGLYKLPSLPAVLGMEGAGRIKAVGANVRDLQPGDRVAYPSALGAYALKRVIPADRVVRLPDAVDSRVAAGVMLRGLTVQALLRQVYEVKPGDPILVHAAAGGIGLLMCQWGRHLGAEVIGVVSTEEKAERARMAGAAHVVVGLDNLPARVKQITDGAMVPVVYDSTGKDGFLPSLDCLRPRGVMVSFGNASGEVTGVALSMLASRGSLYVTRPTLGSFIGKRDRLEAASAELFALLSDNTLKVEIGQEFPLSRVAEAHEAMAARRTTGSTVLIPDQP
ncbi:quinone oxidoreductase family protein [Rhizosaccharibacter radicis]|uniref:Quinone oxidoreductase n=1 Tax=Rhizosaccharibacter radicis TaxID=2782605 RepID=A0ABT1VSV0_9PROT|nr:quinone oxidoreductase [Acetobacteraceae bacterium KSS12]